MSHTNNNINNIPDLNSRINDYLEQQRTAANYTYDEERNTVTEKSIPSENELDDFRKYVKTYLDVDNDIKKLKGAIKERSNVKQEISNYIINFMIKFNIEDLNTKQGKIRYNVKKVKAPLSQKQIKQKIEELHSPSISCEELTKEIFENRGIVEKHSLTRLK